MGLRKILDCVDDAKDFKDYLSSYAPKKGELSFAEYGISPDNLPALKGKPTFGVNLADLLARDEVEVPIILSKSVRIIEEYGTRHVGLYRLSGKNDMINKLKAQFDKGE